MVSCRICDKNLDNENASKHMMQHLKQGEIPHSVGNMMTNSNNEVHNIIIYKDLNSSIDPTVKAESFLKNSLGVNFQSRYKQNTIIHY